jgi:hypothetical protein
MPTHFEGPDCQVLALDTMIKLTRATNTLMARLVRRNTHGELTESQFGLLLEDPLAILMNRPTPSGDTFTLA